VRLGRVGSEVAAGLGGWRDLSASIAGSSLLTPHSSGSY
jgi:hypothetical protein